MKQGIRSSEFWLATVTALIGLLAGFGIIGPEDVDPLAQAIIAIIGGVVAAVNVVSYIVSRTNIKEAEIAAKR